MWSLLHPNWGGSRQKAPVNLPLLPCRMHRKQKSCTALQLLSSSALRQLAMIISLVEADVSSNGLGMFTGWRKDKAAQWFEISFCLPLLEPYSQRAASPLCRRENKIKGICTKSCNSTLKYSFLISLFCQSHSTALTLELGHTQERNKVAWIWHWSVPAHHFGKDLQKCVHCSSSLSKGIQYHQFVQEFISHLSTLVIIKELIYSIPQL